MALSFKDPATGGLAREVATLTGETLTEAIRSALEEGLQREHMRRGGAGLAERLAALGLECAALPNIDTRTPDDIVGYDDIGMWR